LEENDHTIFTVTDVIYFTQEIRRWNFESTTHEKSQKIDAIKRCWRGIGKKLFIKEAERNY